MVINLCSKEKVVRKTGWILLFLGAFHVTSAQPLTLLSGNAISLRCKDCNFEEVLVRLEQVSGMHFIYSPSIVPVNTRLSVDYRNMPIDEALQSLGSSTRLVFLRKGQHVVIKTGKLPSVSKSPAATRTSAPGVAVSGPEQKFTASSARIASKEMPVTAASASSAEAGPTLGEVVMKKPPALLSLYFDASKYPALPARHIQSLNLKNNHRGWFFSGGPVLNDYSAGAEIRGGLRSVYLSFRPAMLDDGRYHVSYGLGTSLPLQHNLSLNTIYSFASLKGGYARSGRMPERFSTDVGILARHHQVRFVLEYAVSPKVSVHAGVSVNLLETQYNLPEAGFAAAAQADMPTLHNVAPGGTFAPMSYQRVVIGRTFATHRPNSPVKMWMGWETSVSYKLNFFQRRKPAN